MKTPPNAPRSRALRLSALAAIGTLALAACGSDAATESSPTDAPVDTEAPASTDMSDMEDEDGMDMDGMDMSEMNMGDPNATAAEDVEGAALARGEFALLDTRPQGYDDVTGTALIARHSGGTTVTTNLSGLLPNVEYISHVHAEACLPNNGGDHYQFEVGGSVMPPNEIHLAFTSDNDGNGFMTAENHDIAGLDGVAFVVHPAEFLDNKIACVDFVEDEAGAAAAALEAGTSGMDHEDMEEMDHDDEGDHDGDHDDDADHDDADHDDEDMEGMDHDDEEMDGEHGDHGDEEMDGEHMMSADLGTLDVPALHDVDEQLAAGTLDAVTQGMVVNHAIEALDEVGMTEANMPLRALLVELQTALTGGDVAVAAPIAKEAHDIAHALETHEAE